MLAVIKRAPQHFWLAVGLAAIGIWLMANDNFFMWPPGAVDVLNDDIWGGLFVVTGMGILIWIGEGANNIKWNRRLLSLAAGLLGFLAAYQFLIWIATGIYMSWISNSILTAFVLMMARGSDTRA